MNFHERLAKLRNRKGMSQAEIAKRMGMARTTYAGYENGSREPDLDNLNKLADFFGVSVSWLVTGTNQSFSDQDEEIVRLFNELPEKGQDYILDVMKKMAEIKKE